MAAGKPLEFIEQLAVEKPALAEDLSELSSLYQRKLWHQLTLKLEDCSNKPEFNQGDLFVRLYNGFIADFGAKLNLLRLAHLAVHASKQIKDPAAAVAFLKAAIDKLTEMKLPRSEEPLLYLRMHVAQQQLEMGQVAECKEAIEEGAAALERLPEPDPRVSASMHYVSSLYYKLKKDYAKFYRSSMQVGSGCAWQGCRRVCAASIAHADAGCMHVPSGVSRSWLNSGSIRCALVGRAVPLRQASSGTACCPATHPAAASWYLILKRPHPGLSPVTILHLWLEYLYCQHPRSTWRLCRATACRQSSSCRSQWTSHWRPCWATACTALRSC